MHRVSRNERARIALTLNGRKAAGDAEPRMLLSDFLRHVLGATGTHVGMRVRRVRVLYGAD